MLIKLCGDLDIDNAGAAKEQIYAALAEHGQCDVDLSELHFIDSTGIGVFLSALTHAVKIGVSSDNVRFINTPAQLKKTFHLLGLDRVLNVIES